MALIGALVVNMQANTGKFGKGLHSAQAMMAAFNKQVGRMGAQVASAGIGKLAAAAAAAAAAFATWRVATGKEIDEQNDLAQRVGISIQGLRELQYAVHLTGSETEALGPAIKKMNANLSDAARAGGPVEESLNRIGLSAKDLVKLDANQAFIRISGAMSGLTSQADKAATAMDIFGKSGQELLNSLSAGAPALQALELEFRSIRGVMSDEDANKVATLQDSLDKAWEALGRVSDTIAVAVAPYLTDLINLFIDLTIQATSSGGAITLIFEGIGKAIEFTSFAIRNWQDLWTVTSLTIMQHLDNFMQVINTIPANMAVVALYVMNNWRPLMTDAINAVSATLVNLGKNFHNFAVALATFFATGQWNFQWTPLLDGFKATMAELPEFIKPAVDRLQPEIDEAWKRIHEREKAHAEQIGKGLGQALQRPERTLEGKEAKTKFAGALSLGTKEARSALLEQRIGTKDSRAAEQLNISRRQLETEQKILKELEQQNAQTPGDWWQDLTTAPLPAG